MLAPFFVPVIQHMAHTSYDMQTDRFTRFWIESGCSGKALFFTGQQLDGQQKDVDL